MRLSGEGSIIYRSFFRSESSYIALHLDPASFLARRAFQIQLAKIMRSDHGFYCANLKGTTAMRAHKMFMPRNIAKVKDNAD
jgi:hypothetical protein